MLFTLSVFALITLSVNVCLVVTELSTLALDPVVGDGVHCNPSGHAWGTSSIPAPHEEAVNPVDDTYRCTSGYKPFLYQSRKFWRDWYPPSRNCEDGEWTPRVLPICVWDHGEKIIRIEATTSINKTTISLNSSDIEGLGCLRIPNDTLKIRIYLSKPTIIRTIRMSAQLSVQRTIDIKPVLGPRRFCKLGYQVRGQYSEIINYLETNKDDKAKEETELAEQLRTDHTSRLMSFLKNNVSEVQLEDRTYSTTSYQFACEVNDPEPELDDFSSEEFIQSYFNSEFEIQFESGSISSICELEVLSPEPFSCEGYQPDIPLNGYHGIDWGDLENAKIRKYAEKFKHQITDWHPNNQPISFPINLTVFPITSTFTCDERYKLLDSNNSNVEVNYHCAPDGRLLGQAPIGCVLEVPCPAFKDNELTNVTVSYTDYSFIDQEPVAKIGTRASFECKLDQGHNLTRIGPEIVVCTEFGWSDKPPVCNEPTINNSMQSSNQMTNANLITYVLLATLLIVIGFVLIASIFVRRKFDSVRKKRTLPQPDLIPDEDDYQTDYYAISDKLPDDGLYEMTTEYYDLQLGSNHDYVDTRLFTEYDDHIPPGDYIEVI